MGKSKLHELLLTEGNFPVADYPNASYRPQSKSIKVPKDIYEEGKLESEVRKDVQKFLKTHGYLSTTVYVGPIPIHGGQMATNPMKGFPDQIVLHPFKNQCFFLELKRNSGGVLTPEQQTWHWDLRNSGQTVFVITSVELLKHYLMESDLL